MNVEISRRDSEGRGPPSSCGRRDFWDVYSRNYEWLFSEVLSSALGIGGMGDVLCTMPADHLARQAEGSRERIMRAVLGGEWGPYEATLRAEVEQFAAAGVPVAAWHELRRAFSRRMIPLLVAEFAGTSERLTGSLLAMEAFLDRGLQIVHEVCLDATPRPVRASDRPPHAAR